MKWEQLRIFIIACDILSVVTNLILILIFRSLWKNLRDKAWLLIIGAYFLALMNNLIIAYLFIFQIRTINRLEIMVLITIFSVDQALKNFMWLVGFVYLRHYFNLVEATPDSVWKSKLIDDLSENTVKENENE